MTRKKRPSVGKVYQAVPSIDCKGLCHEVCGVVPMAGAEHDYLLKHQIPPPDVKSDLCCTHLNDSRRCAIYQHRPLSCRLYGVAEDLKCPHGCKPDRYLSVDEQVDLLVELNKIYSQNPSRFMSPDDPEYRP